MARYRGPSAKISRRFGESILGYCKQLKNKNHPPGQHGPSRRRRKKSDYALQLNEKQKTKYIYGLMERQFKNVFEKSFRMKGITGELLLQLLEMRLDNIIYRSGFAPTRRSARQLVNHRHVLVNDKIVDIPSFTIKPKDTLRVRDKSKSMNLIQESLKKYRSRFSWLEVDNKELASYVQGVPQRNEIPEKIKEQLIVELYSK